MPLLLKLLIFQNENKYECNLWIPEDKLKKLQLKDNALFLQDNSIKYYNYFELKNNWLTRSAKLSINYDFSINLITKNNIEVIKGSMPCYFYKEEPEHQNKIYCPEPDFFVSKTEYYVTIFHEMMHWASFKLYGIGDYILNEFIAEIGAELLAIHCKLPIINVDLLDIYCEKWVDLFIKDNNILNDCFSKIDSCLSLILD
jgi:hypothetical protein